MELRMFKNVQEMERAAVALLAARLGKTTAQPHAVILPGGRTPRGIYEKLRLSPVRTGPALRVLLSDERHVPPDSPESNYGAMKEMIHALGLKASHVLRVHAELPLEEAANRYDAELKSYFRKGGRITLGLLGLGADGHTASLFTSQDILRGRGRLAIAVKRPDGLSGVSVTRDLLLKAERIVFIAAGTEKGEIVTRLMKNPGSIPAGMATEDIRNVEVWYAP